MNQWLPESTLPGFVPTLNATGWMTLHLDPISEAFVEFAAHCGSESLDIGCAYGVATLPALARGARMLACDMEERHLQILQRRTPSEHRNLLRVQTAMLPAVNFPAHSFGAILCSRALHFLRGPDITTSVQLMAKWLKPGGRLFLVADSPFGGPWASRAADYERRKAAGDPWPAFVSSFLDLLPPDADPAQHPKFINPLDPDILRREVEASGLRTIECRWLPGFQPGSPPNIRAGVVAARRNAYDESNLP